MTTTDTDTDTIPEALATGLLGIDASRRVGWAKAFERARHVESLEEQVSVLESELKTLRLCYIRLVGFTTYLPVRLGADPSHRTVFDAEMNLHRSAIRPYMSRQAYNSGRREADKHRAVLGNWDEERLKEQDQKHDRHTAAYREEERELTDKAQRAGHDARFDAQPDGTFRCSCSCGEEAATETDHQAWAWVAKHKILVVHGLDSISEYRRLRKGAGPRCICDVCGDVHGKRPPEETP